MVNLVRRMEVKGIFFPKINANSAGSYEFKFKMNDALTKWKFMTFAMKML